MQQPALSFASVNSANKSSSPAEAEAGGSSLIRKRKRFSIWDEPPPQRDPRPRLSGGALPPPDRKAWRRGWRVPGEQGVLLDLNKPPMTPTDGHVAAVADAPGFAQGGADSDSDSSSSDDNMVAMPCGNCHLLVLLFTSAPSCPNCNFVEPLGSATSKPSRRTAAARP